MTITSEEPSNGIWAPANAAAQANPGAESMKSAQTNGLLSLSASRALTTFMWAEAIAVSKRRTTSACACAASSLRA